VRKILSEKSHPLNEQYNPKSQTVPYSHEIAFTIPISFVLQHTVPISEFLK
jgi:hypothetical protein